MLVTPLHMHHCTLAVTAWQTLAHRCRDLRFPLAWHELTLQACLKGGGEGQHLDEFTLFSLLLGRTRSSGSATARAISGRGAAAAAANVSIGGRGGGRRRGCRGLPLLLLLRLLPDTTTAVVGHKQVLQCPLALPALLLAATAHKRGGQGQARWVWICRI